MRIFIALSLCVVFVCAENLGLRQACNKEDGDSSCQAGLSCVLTKKLIKDDNVISVKQCMPQGDPIFVETVDLDTDEKLASSSRAKRFLFPSFKNCQSEADCSPNECCLNLIFIRRCIMKIPENGACNLNQLHGCGCEEGLTCQKTTDVATPIPGINVPLEQCVRM